MKGARRRIGLGPKAVAVLLAIALAPLVAASFLIDQVAEVAQSFASQEAARLVPRLDDAREAYRELIADKKRLYNQLAARLVAEVAAGRDPATRARALLEEEPELVRVELGRAGALLARIARDGAAPPDPARSRPLEVRATGDGGVTAALTFAADLSVVERYQALGRAIAERRQVETMRGALPRSYRIGFLALLGAVVLIASVTGIALARRLTRRIDRLVAGTRTVAGGDLSTRVAIGGRDELAELGDAFDAMVVELGRGREHILYLERMAAWQDVARRLAHEIKNPLTPIQLAVQQLESSYAGDDARHKKLLADVREIVGEEIAGLRRLVDAFRELGRLPAVDPQPIDLAVVVDDLVRESAFAPHVVVRPPAAPVVVSGDRLMLRRVLANLVENGIHAGQAAGRDGAVVVSWSSDAATGRARLTVDDEGGGVPAADRERIFEPYVTSKETGTGLGLPIARKIALEHHGDLTLSSDAAPTGGARFCLDLGGQAPTPSSA